MKVICGQGPSVLVTRARPVFFCVTDFRERCNAKEAKFEETNFVKRVVKIVRRRVELSGTQLSLPTASLAAMSHSEALSRLTIGD
jgi:hypothetical protein